MKETYTQFIQPNADKLLRLISENIDDSMLLEIAEADYGYDYEKHLVALKEIRDIAKIPMPIEWHPQEVLELIRWSMPDDPEWKPGSTGMRGYFMRAFCCAALLRAQGEPVNYELMPSMNDSLVILLDSIEKLGNEYEEATLEFLVWFLGRFNQDDEEYPFILLALLYLALKVRKELAPSVYQEFIDDLLELEELARKKVGSIDTEWSNQWLLGLTFFDLRHTLWIELGAKLRELSKGVSDSVVAKSVIGISDRLKTG